ncbi:hypothetical protein XHV734_4081 [Xanthomonas hortorum pv. vitians]|nr:hypothetical protein XHV734_4081 [Xanthomonas hortorum pv. vitians]
MSFDAAAIVPVVGTITSPAKSKLRSSISSTRPRFSFNHLQQPVVLARVPAWDLTRHGCRVRAYRDVLAACPTSVRVQAPAANRRIRVEPVNVVHKIDRSAELVGSVATHPVTGLGGGIHAATRSRPRSRHRAP